jgi:hypothetical protein
VPQFPNQRTEWVAQPLPGEALAAGPRPVGMCLAQPCALGGSQAGQLQPLTSSQPFLDGCRLGTVALVGKGPARAVSCPGSQPWARDHLPDSAHTLGRHRVGHWFVNHLLCASLSHLTLSIPSEKRAHPQHVPQGTMGPDRVI